MRVVRLLSIGLLVLAPLAASGNAVTELNYDAFLGDHKVGEAEVQIKRSGASYQIEGQAHSIGLTGFLTRWRSFFAAAGRFILGAPVAERYDVVQKQRDKEKRIVLRDGVVSYERNGEAHAPRPKLPSMDLLSALFLSQDCATPGNEVHNGKDAFELTLTQARTFDQPTADGAVLQCEFEVIDEDQENSHAVVRLTERGGLKVPLSMTLSGALEGSLRLQI